MLIKKNDRYSDDVQLCVRCYFVLELWTKHKLYSIAERLRFKQQRTKQVDYESHGETNPSIFLFDDL